MQAQFVWLKTNQREAQVLDANNCVHFNLQELQYKMSGNHNMLTGTVICQS